MFSLRIAVRSARLSGIHSASKAQALVASRCVASVTRVPQLSTPNFFGIAQRRNFGDDADQTQPGQRFSPAMHKGPDGAPLAPTDTLYVGNLQFDTTEQDLHDYFSTVGEVKGTKVIQDVKGLSKGFGYVQFGDLDTSIKVCEKLNNTILNGRRLNVQFLARPSNNKMGPNPPSKTLFIGNMNYEMTDEDINELFKDVKNCLDVRVAMDRRTGQPRGFAHADFADVESAAAAKEKLAGRIFFGRALRIDFSASERTTERLNGEGAQ